MNSTIRVISGDWNILPVMTLRITGVILKITLSFEISETMDDKFVPTQEMLAMNSLKSQCY